MKKSKVSSESSGVSFLESKDDNPFFVPLRYQKTLIEDFAAKSGLLVMARGLGMDSVIQSLLHLYACPQVLVFVLNVAWEDEEVVIEEEEINVKNQATNQQRSEWETYSHIHQVKTETSIKERQRIYCQGGVIFVSPRVFLMDLLKGRIPIPLITGVLVNNVDRYLNIV